MGRSASAITTKKNPIIPNLRITDKLVVDKKIIRENEIGNNVKYWVRPDIINRIKEGSIPAFFNSEIIEIKKESIIIKTKKGKKEIKNDFVLAMTGYEPNFKLLEEIGVNFKKDKYRTPKSVSYTHLTLPTKRIV